MLKKLAYLVLIVFFAVASVAVYSLTVGLQKGTETILEPVGALVRELAFSATPEILPDPVTIVREINTLARLETASMTMEKVITAERNQEQLFGVFGESLVFVAYGEVVAGVDLARMGPADIQVLNPTTVQVHLPPAQRFELPVVDNQRSYVADRDRGLLASVDKELETLVRQEAERQLIEAALEAGLLDLAQTNAENYLRQLLQNLGFETIVFTDSPPPPAPPYEPAAPKGYIFTTPTP